MPRVVILGCGTAVGKTRVSTALLRELTRRGVPTLGLKPIESGLASSPPSSSPPSSSPLSSSPPPPGSDAEALSIAGSSRTVAPHPLYGFRDPVSPHLAARTEGHPIDVKRVVTWVAQAETDVALLIGPHRAIWSVIESAGGVFSPLSTDATNFELALALDPAIWVLVAADALGVLHDVSAALQAMRAKRRLPDHLVLSGARAPDASTGSNAGELELLGIATTSAVLARDDDRGVAQLVDRLLTPH